MMTDAESGFRRQWRIYRLLSGSEGETLADLADQFEVSTKTITRDIATLRAVGLNVVESTEKFGLKRWRVEADTTKFPRLQWDEAAAIYLGRRFLEPMAGSLFWEEATGNRSTLAAARHTSSERKPLGHIEARANQRHSSATVPSSERKPLGHIEAPPGPPIPG